MKWGLTIILALTVLFTIVFSKAFANPSFDIQSQNERQGLVCKFDCHTEVEVIAQDEIVADSLRNQFGVR